MGHDAKVCLKHYAQTTEDHFDRPAGGAESGAREAQNRAQRDTVGIGGDSQTTTEPDEGEPLYANSDEALRYTAHSFR